MIDISWPLHGSTTEYKDRETLAIELRARFETHGMEESSFCMAMHTGTHIDAPGHFIKGGKALDQFPLSTFFGECLVIDVSSCEEMIPEEALKNYDIEKGAIVLLKTRNSLLPSDGPFYKEFVYLSESGAHYLAHKEVKLVGIDYLSLERGQPGHPTHKALLSKDIPIIEGLRLAAVEEGRYTLYCLPLKFMETEAAPCRAVLVAL